MALNGNQENAWDTAEKNNKNKTDYFDFKWPINEFIEKKIDWNALYFKWKKSSEIWDEFIAFLKKSDVVISLGNITMSHKIAKAVLLEQIYRGFSILTNHPYHK